MPLWIVSTRRQRHRDPLEPAALELALHAQPCAPVDLHFHDDRRVRHAELLGEHDADLREALIVGLEAGQDEIDLLVLERRGERVGDAERVGRRQRVALDVNRAIGAARERLANHLRDARRARPSTTTTSPPCFSLSRSASSSA